MEKKTKEEIYMEEQEKHTMQFGAYTLPEQWQLDAMEEYAQQFKSEWVKVTTETMPEVVKDTLVINNDKLLILHYLPFKSYEFGFWNGSQWEMPDTGFAELNEVDMYFIVPPKPEM